MKYLLKDRTEVRKLLAAVLSSLIGAAGFTLVGKNVFNGRVFLVATGFFVFIFSYKLMWYGTQDSLKDLAGSSKGSLYIDFIDHVNSELRNYGLIISGVLVSSLGTVYFGAAAQSFSVLTASSAGLLAFGGYMIAHEGVNNVLV